MIIATHQRIYRCSDGREFLDSQEAVKYEANLELYRALEKDSVGRGGPWDTEMIRDWMLANREKLVMILNPEIHNNG